MSTVVEQSPAVGEPAAPFARTRRLAGPVALVVGCVTAQAGMSLHIKDAAEDVHFVNEVAAAPAVWLTSHVMMGIGWALFAGGILTVLRLVRRRGAKLAGVAAGVASVGGVLMALGDISHGTLAFALVDQVEAARSLEIQQDYFANPAVLALALGGMLIPLGVMLLGAALLRARTVPVWLAVTLLVSPAFIQLGYSTDLPLAPFVLPFVFGIAVLGRRIAQA